MAYLLPNRYLMFSSAKIKNDRLSGMLSLLVKGIRRIALRVLTPKDREMEIMMNELGVKLPVNARSWKRNSALIVHSKFSRLK